MSEYEEKLKIIIDTLGLSEIRKCIPFTDEELAEMYNRDVHFNEKMSLWEIAAGFRCHGSAVVLVGSRLMDMMQEKLDTKTFSIAGNISILKEAARMYITELEGR